MGGGGKPGGTIKCRPGKKAGAGMGQALFVFFPDGLFEHPAAVFVFVKDVAVVELVDDGPELGFAVAAEGAEILHAQGVQIAVARFDDGDGLVAGHLPHLSLHGVKAGKLTGLLSAMP